MTIEQRMAALGLTVKPKKQSTPMEDQSDVQLRATAKNPSAKDATRIKAMDILEARAKSKAKASK